MLPADASMTSFIYSMEVKQVSLPSIMEARKAL